MTDLLWHVAGWMTFGAILGSFTPLVAGPMHRGEFWNIVLIFAMLLGICGVLVYVTGDTP